MAYRFKGRTYTSHSMGSKAYQPFKYIQKGSKTHKMLNDIAKYSYNKNGMDYNKLKPKYRTKNTTQGLDRTLRRLERTGLVSRPRRGFYTITSKGKAALSDLKYGLWRK